MLRSKNSSIQRTSCPKCGRCPFVDGVCEEKVSRGRRFFMLGALALPVAAQIARVAEVVKPAYETPRLEYLGMNVMWTFNSPIHVGDVLKIEGSMKSNGRWIVTKADGTDLKAWSYPG